MPNSHDEMNLATLLDITARLIVMAAAELARGIRKIEREMEAEQEPETSPFLDRDQR